MGGLAASVVAIAILLGLVLFVGFIVVCLIRLAAADRVLLLPKWVWAAFIVCLNPLGGAVYLLSEHLVERSPNHPDRARDSGRLSRDARETPRP